MRQLMCKRGGAVHLRLVPIWVVRRHEVDVVRRRVAVGDADVLIHDHAQHVRFVVATILIKHDRCRRSGKSVITNLLGAIDRPLFYVDESIRQLAVFDGPVFGHQVRALLRTLSIGRGIDLLAFRRGAGERDLAGDSSFVAGRNIRRSLCCRGRATVVGLRPAA
ncbi:MAG: hypothetical protein DMF70_11115 [Acidobacteria bacterium]|nr:MAG: hypothetical protein DMF70_11115 [Acidobacteriota bacterium]